MKLIFHKKNLRVFIRDLSMSTLLVGWQGKSSQKHMRSISPAQRNQQIKWLLMCFEYWTRIMMELWVSGSNFKIILQDVLKSFGRFTRKRSVSESFFNKVAAWDFGIFECSEIFETTCFYRTPLAQITKAAA